MALVVPAPVGVRAMVAAGWRALSRYTGTLLAVFVVQMIVSAACMLAVAAVLAPVFAHSPLFDDAVDGDLVALITCVRAARSAIVASGGIVFGFVLLWQLATWFLVGGIYGVLAQQPEGRGATARCFGASGTATYLTYARLALCELPGWLLVVFALSTGLGMAWPHIEHALTIAEAVVPLAAAVLPSLILFHLAWTIGDYARLELTLRQDSHAPGVVATYLRSVAFVVTRPITLVHASFGWIGFAIVTIGSMFLAQGHAMFGAEGAITLYVIREGTALARLAIRFAVLGGQVELARTRPLPPRRVEAKLEAIA